MFYKRLKEEYKLRGYKDCPYLLIKHENGFAEFLSKEQFYVLSLCDGMMDFELLLLTNEQRRMIEFFEEKGIINSLDYPMELEEFQRYQKADNYYIRSLHWSVTGHCNLKCKHCYMSAPDGKYHDLTLDECFAVIEQMKEAKISTVSITGGEPFLRKDIFAIFERIYESGIEISQIYTNGTLLNLQSLEYFSKKGKKPEFVLSFDGIKGHDWLRGSEGSRDKVMEAIRLLKWYGFPVMIESALYEKNLLELPEMYECLKALKIDYWKTSFIFDAGEWRRLNKEQIQVEDLYRVYLELIGYYVADDAPFAIQLDGFFACRKGDVGRFYSPYHRKPEGGNMEEELCCRTCRINPYLLPDGTLIPCATMTDSQAERDMPNLKKQTISSIYRDPVHPFFKLANMRIKEVYQNNEECRMCEYWNICHGGCRAMSFIENYGIYGHSSVICKFFKGDYEIQIETIVNNTERRKV